MERQVSDLEELFEDHNVGLFTVCWFTSGRVHSVHAANCAEESAYVGTFSQQAH